MPSPYVKQVARARDRARQRGLRADLSIYEWAETMQDFEGACAYCDRRCWTLDHFYPLSSGGSTSIGNCVPSCYTCNNRKGSLLPDELCFVPHSRIEQICAYLERRVRGLRGWPPPPEVSRQQKHNSALGKKKVGDQMSTKDMQWTAKTYASGKKILLYSDAQQVVLQLRYHVPTEEDVITPSFRVAVSMTPAETVALAMDLLRAASPPLDQMQRLLADRAQTTEHQESEAEVTSHWPL